MNLSDELDRSFGAGPTPPPAEAVLAAGHRALRRRRRAGAGLALVAVAAVLVGGLTLGAPVVDGLRDELPSTPVAEPPSTGVARAPAFTGSLGGGVPLTVDADGALVADPGHRIVREEADPLYRQAPLDSWAAEVRGPGGARYYLAWTGPSGAPTVVSRSARRAAVPFTDWLAATTVRGGFPLRDLVHLDEAGTGFVALPGVTLLSERTGIALPGDAVGPADRTGLALVRWRGVELWVVGRRLPDGRSEYLTDPRADHPTADAALAQARRVYAARTALR